MKTNWLKLAIALFTIIVAFPLQAQKLIKKELKTKNNSNDGFQYQWNMYTYVDGKDTLQAAFDLNNERITPNGYKYKGDYGVYYSGGGMFFVKSNKKDAFGRIIISGYNVKGECIFPENSNVIFAYYEGDGYFSIQKSNMIGEKEVGLYSYRGNCIIPESLGYTWIAYYDKYECFWCSKTNALGDDYDKRSYSKDGNYYADGYCNKEEFQKTKRLVPNRSSYASSQSNSSSISNHSNNNASNSSTNGLLYEGDYTQGNLVSQTTGMSMPPFFSQHHIKIYEDHIEDCGNWYYEGMSGGKRIYIDEFSINDAKYYVDGNYNITEYRNVSSQYGYESYVSHFTKGNVTFDVNNQTHNYNGSDNHNHSTSQSSTGKTAHQVTKDCPLCHGSGKCNTCNGKHWYYGFTGERITCPNCKPNGACSKCGGSGKITVTEWY